MYQLTSQVTN